MAITDNAIVVKNIPADSNEWTVSLYSADVSGTEELMAAVTGKYHYIRKIIIDCASAITVSIGGGETTGALTATYIGPIPFAATTGQKIFDFGNKGMKLAVSTALCIDASGAGAVSVVVEGHTSSSNL